MTLIVRDRYSINRTYLELRECCLVFAVQIFTVGSLGIFAGRVCRENGRQEKTNTATYRIPVAVTEPFVSRDLYV